MISLNRTKFILVLTFNLILSLSLMGCSSSSSGANGDKGSSEKDQIILKLSEAQVDDYPDTVAERAFAKEVEEKSNGRIKIEVYSSGQLGDEKTTIEQAQVGIVDMGRANSGPLVQFADKFGIFSFPFLFDSREHLNKSLEAGLREELFSNLEENNLIGLAFYDAGARNFYSSKPITTLEDMKGKKIRVLQNDLLIEATKLWDASPTPLAASEVYSALQMGVIDSAENNVSTYVADGNYEVAKNFTVSEHLRVPGVLFIGKAAWDKLSQEDQKIIKEAAIASEKIQIEEFEKFSNEAMMKVEQAEGSKVIELSEEEREKFKEKVAPIYNKYEDKYGELFNIIEKAR